MITWQSHYPCGPNSKWMATLSSGLSIYGGSFSACKDNKLQQSPTNSCSQRQLTYCHFLLRLAMSLVPYLINMLRFQAVIGEEPNMMPSPLCVWVFVCASFLHNLASHSHDSGFQAREYSFQIAQLVRASSRSLTNQFLLGYSICMSLLQAA